MCYRIAAALSGATSQLEGPLGYEVTNGEKASGMGVRNGLCCEEEQAALAECENKAGVHVPGQAEERHRWHDFQHKKFYRRHR